MSETSLYLLIFVTFFGKIKGNVLDSLKINDIFGDGSFEDDNESMVIVKELPF